MATSSSVTCWTAYDHLPHNVDPYNSNNPLLLDYSRWYSIVLGITAQSNNTGRAQLWVNGVKLVDRTGCTMDPGGVTVKRLYYSGTIAQAGYDSPQHKRLFDRLIFTDAWTDITNGGYLKDPNDGSIVTPKAPAAPRNLNVK